MLICETMLQILWQVSPGLRRQRQGTNQSDRGIQMTEKGTEGGELHQRAGQEQEHRAKPRA